MWMTNNYNNNKNDCWKLSNDIHVPIKPNKCEQSRIEGKSEHGYIDLANKKIQFNFSRRYIDNQQARIVEENDER